MTEYPIIDASTLINHIESVTKKFTKNPKANVHEALALIEYYFANPNRVQRASYQGGLEQIKEKYADDLFRIRMAQSGSVLTQAQAKQANRGFTLLAQRIKLKRAYAELYRGKKFQKAGLGIFNPRHPISQENPIAKHSAENIKKLKEELNKRKGVISKSFGIREDERELFAELLNLPYKLQHATNHYYETLNAGSFNSYRELRRQQPDYESPFSTKGNVEKLGNDGFVFFRVFIDPINSSQTRYGDTSLVFDINLLRKCGWISLHDQLNSFPSTNVNTRHFYWGNRLLRTSEAVPINNKTKDKGLHDGLAYKYRVSKFTPKGKKDTLKSFGNGIDITERTPSFLSEMFYGKDILIGIALSVIRELWYLQDSGFREFFLTQFMSASPTERVALLGNLIKGFFRIEGKYPVKLKLQADLANKTQFFEPVAKTDVRLSCDSVFSVINPDGDGRFLLDMSENGFSKDVAHAREEEKTLKELLSVSRRQKGRFKDDAKKEKKYQAQVDAVDKKLETTREFLSSKENERVQLINYFKSNYEVESGNFAKVDVGKLKFIRKNYNDLLQRELVELDVLLLAPASLLMLLSKKHFLNLIIYTEDIQFSDLITCSIPQLEAIDKVFTDSPNFYNLFLDDSIRFSDFTRLTVGTIESLGTRVNDEDFIEQIQRKGFGACLKK